MDGTDAARSERRRAWAYAGLMMLCILLTLPTTPMLWRSARKIFGSGIDHVGYVVLFVVVLAAGIYISRLRPGSRRFRLFMLLVFGSVYLYLIKYQCKYPAERLHLVEYGLLAYLIYAALRLDFSGRAAYALSFALASGFGLVDELIQYVLPNRVFEMRDVMTNVFAAGLGLLAVRLLFEPKSAETLTARNTFS